MPSETADSNHQVPNDFRVGEVVFDKYKIVRFINSGGNGRVYRVTDLLRNVDVALKVLVMHQADTNALVRFQREARTASKLKHPNIATIYDFNVAEKTPYLVMEFIEGESLEEKLSGGDTLNLQTFCDIFFQLSLAVEHAHKQSIVHRDLKPQNVMVSENPDGTLKVVVLDFGVAKALDDTEAGKLTGTGGVVGSPLYMSPEQASAKEVSTKSDLYSIGAMMFRSLIGKPPLKAASAIETIMLVASSSAPSIRTFNQEIPPSICDIVDGLLSRDPNQRPSLTESVIPTLREVADSLGATLEAPALVAEPAFAGIKRLNNKTILFIFCVLATTLGVIGFVAFKKINQIDPSKALRTDLEEEYTTESESKAIEHKLLGRDAAPKQFRTLKTSDFKAQHTPLIDWENSNANDESLFLVPDPESVTDLRLHKTEVATLKALPRFSNLKKLYLGQTKIADKSLQNIVKLPLDTLDLEDTKITNEGLEFVSKIKYLEHLTLASTKVTADGFKFLKPLNYLRDLYINDLVIKPADLTSNILNFAPNCSIWFSQISEKDLDKLRIAFPDINFHESLGELALRRRAAEDKFLTGAPLAMTEATSEYRKIVKTIEEAYSSQSPRLRRPLLALATGQNATEKSRGPQQIEELKTVIRMSQEVHDELCESQAWALLSKIYAERGECGELRNSVYTLLKLQQRLNARDPNIALNHYRETSGKLLNSKCVKVAQQTANDGLKFAQTMKSPNTYSVAKLHQIKAGAAMRNLQLGEAIADYRKSIALMEKVVPFTKERCVEQIASYAFLAHCEELQKNYDQAFRTNREARKLCQPGIPYDSQLLIYGQALGLSEVAKCSKDELNTILQRVTELKKLTGVE